MKVKEILNTTTNSNVYKRVRGRYVTEKYGGCSHCSPNNGCNRVYKMKDNIQQSWKSHRKTQWK